MNFQDQTAVVSGGGCAVGRAIALRLAKGEADIVLFRVDVEELETTAAEVRHRGCRLLDLVADVFFEY